MYGIEQSLSPESAEHANKPKAVSDFIFQNWSVVEVRGGHSLSNFTRDIKNCTAEECRRGTPLNVTRIEGSDIPDDAVALAADLGTGELLLQFFGDEMIFIPELHDPRV